MKPEIIFGIPLLIFLLGRVVSIVRRKLGYGKWSRYEDADGWSDDA